MLRFVIYLSVLQLIFLLIQFCAKQHTLGYKTLSTHIKKATLSSNNLKHYAHLLQNVANEKGYNTTFVFLIDMKLPSGGNRFFVYNLKKDSIVNAGLVTHGSGTDKLEQIVFSNTKNSNCTSLGKYKIGKAYLGKFGLAYKLYGLDSTNSNAYNRFIVLHSHTCVPEKEVQPLQICESWGCPTVSPQFLLKLQAIINNSEKPMLLQIIY